MANFVAIDVETANSFMGSICQIGAVRFAGGQPVEVFSTLIDPQCWFDDMNIAIHGIEEHHVVGAPTFKDAFPALREFIGSASLVHHTHFDRVSLRQACAEAGIDVPSFRWLDSAKVTRRTWPQFAQSGYGLSPVAQYLGIAFQHHDAAEDARAAGEILCAAIVASGIQIEDWHLKVDQKITDNSPKAHKREGADDGPLAGELVVFTGALAQSRRLCADRAAALGADVSGTLTLKTTLLVLGDQDLTKLAGQEKSAKHRKAEQMMRDGLPIRIIAERDFMAL